MARSAFSTRALDDLRRRGHRLTSNVFRISERLEAQDRVLAREMRAQAIELASTLLLMSSCEDAIVVRSAVRAAAQLEYVLLLCRELKRIHRAAVDMMLHESRALRSAIEVSTR